MVELWWKSEGTDPKAPLSVFFYLVDLARSSTEFRHLLRCILSRVPGLRYTSDAARGSCGKPWRAVLCLVEEARDGSGLQFFALAIGDCFAHQCCDYQRPPTTYTVLQERGILLLQQHASYTVRGRPQCFICVASSLLGGCLRDGTKRSAIAARCKKFGGHRA